MEIKKRKFKVKWWPQPRQLRALQACGLSFPFDAVPYHKAVADVIGYGGAAGGGKTDTMLMIAIIAAKKYPKINIGYFRREFPQLEGPGGAIMRARELIGHFARYNEQKKRWTFPNGSILQFCHCKDPNDVYNYQSQQIDILLIDEVTQFTKEMVKYLITRNRSMTVNSETFAPFAFFGTNPGNIGHQYFKDEFVELGPAEQVNNFTNESGDIERHIFIPSKLDDNQILMKRDPKYEMKLGGTELNRLMLREGSWDVFAGQGFGELDRSVHLIDPFEVPEHWKVFGAFDWGYNHPYSFGVFAVSDDGVAYLVGHASGRLKEYPDVARHMVQACAPVGGFKRLSYVVAGHDLWARLEKDKGPTLAEKFAQLPKDYPDLPAIFFRKANIDRVQGSHHVRRFIAWKNQKRDEKGNPIHGEPRFYIFNNYQDVYNTLVRMIFDKDGPNPEDIKKVDADENGYGGDDDYDMVRYGLMSRPRPAVIAPKPLPATSVLGHIKKMEEQRALAQEYVGYNS